jgi:hypothetical protein
VDEPGDVLGEVDEDAVVDDAVDGGVVAISLLLGVVVTLGLVILEVGVVDDPGAGALCR